MSQITSHPPAHRPPATGRFRTYHKRMNDPSSAFLAAAFAAGIVEGSSIIRHYRRAFNYNNAPSSINVAAHSVLYAGVSLPLGIIGASPGVAFYPKALKLCIDAVEVHQVQAKHDMPARVLEDEDASRESEMQKTTMTSTASPHVAGTGRGIGKMLREENLKKIHSHTHQLEQLEPATENIAAAAHLHFQSLTPPSSSSSGLSRYISTLDGRTLPTPVSEAMRRSRGLFVGAAFVSFSVMKFMSINTMSDRQSNEHIAEAIVNENGEVDHNHGIELQKRLATDVDVVAASSDLPSNKILYAYKQVKAKVLNRLLEAITKVEEQLLVNRSEDSPLKLLYNWKETISSKNSRPIALRLVLNEENKMPFVSPNSKSLFPWLTTETENRNRQRKNNPFFVLPIYYSDNDGIGSNHNIYNPRWQFDHEQKSLNELPIGPSWLLKTIDANQALTNKLIMEANICPSIHQLLQHGKGDSQNLVETQPSHEVDMISRMLDNLARSRCQDSTQNISSSTIMICDKETVARIPTNSVCLDGLDVLRWSIICTINKMSSPAFNIDNQTSTAADKDDSGTTGARITTRLTKYVTGKETSSSWSVIDVTTVIGTSIRHLFQSTYRIASAVTFLGRPLESKISTTKVISESSKVITVISPYKSTSAWLAKSLMSRGWKTIAINPNHDMDSTIIRGIVLVLGRSDLETCEIARSLIEESESGINKDSDRQLLLLLDNSKYEMLSHFFGKIGTEKATILCTDRVYELAFAIVRSGLSRGMSSEEVQVELENIFS